MRRPRLRRFLARGLRDESGIVIVWMTIVIVLLLSVAAFAVDLVHAYVEAERAQNAADAAALAGSTLVPDNPDCIKPTATALDLAKSNGFDPMSSGADTVTVDPRCSGPNEMTVEVSRTFDTFFARIMGFNRLTVKRKGVAQYDAPLQMGSPTNWVGSVPLCPNGAAATFPGSCLNAPEIFAEGYLWAAVQGPEGDKAQGNALTTNDCVQQASDDCDTLATPHNTDHAPSGSEYYLVNNPANETGSTLDIFGYDLGFVATQVGGQPICDPGQTNLGGYAGVPSVATHFKLSEPQFCTGDTSFNSSQPVDTTFTVYKPDGDSDPSNNTQQVCSLFIPGKAAAGNPNAAPANAFSDAVARPYFHQWQSVCSIGNAVAGDYVVRVTASGLGKGTNQFGLLGLHNASTPDHISVYARDKLALAAVDPNGGGSKFYLTRVFPSELKRTLVLSFFDLGDNSIGSPPARTGEIVVEATNDVSASFRTALGTTGSGICSYRPPPIYNTGPRTLPLTSPLQPPNATMNPGCSFRYDSNITVGHVTWDSRWVQVEVTLPGIHDTNGYDCSDTLPLGCWLILDMKPDGGGALSDATTWSAHIQGGPVRLVG